MAGDSPRRAMAKGVVAFEQAVEEVGITGHCQMQMIADLAGKSR